MAATGTAAEAMGRERAGARGRMEALQDGIIDLILDGGLEAGDLLPSEQELCARLGTGRNTLREVLKALQAVGIIEISHGYGTCVAPMSLDALALGLDFRGRLSLRHGGRDALELVDTLRLLASGLAGAAIDAITDAQLAALRATAEWMEKLADAGESTADEELLFHRRLFEPLENGLLSNLMEVFGQVCGRLRAEAAVSAAAGGAGVAGIRGTAGRLSPAAAAKRHRGIYEAVAGADPDRAAELIDRHFDAVRELILERAGS